MKIPPVAPPPREDGLLIYQTERGTLVRVEVGGLAVQLEGCTGEAEAVAAVAAALEVLARGRGKLPEEQANPTPKQLCDALASDP